MTSSAPLEVWNAILDHTYDSNMLSAASVCRSWRAHLFSRLFRSLTIVVEHGPWKALLCTQTSEFRAIVSHVCEIQVVAANETESPEDWDTRRVFRTIDVGLLARILPMFDNLATLRIRAVCFECVDDLRALVVAARRILDCLELDDVEDYAADTIDTGRRMTRVPTGVSIRSLRCRLCSFDDSQTCGAWYFLRRPGYDITDLDLNLAVKGLSLSGACSHVHVHGRSCAYRSLT
jgi:hypothetical protein